MKGKCAETVLQILPLLQVMKTGISIYLTFMSSGDIVVNHSAHGAKGHRFDPQQEVETFQDINFSAHNIVGDWPR